MAETGGFHEELGRRQTVEAGSERAFGIVFACVFSVIAVWPLFSGGSARIWAAIAAAGFLVLALVLPRVLRPLNLAWHRFGLLLHKIVTPLIRRVPRPIRTSGPTTQKGPISTSRSISARESTTAVEATAMARSISIIVSRDVTSVSRRPSLLTDDFTVESRIRQHHKDVSLILKYAEKAGQELIRMANEAGGPDNISLILIRTDKTFPIKQSMFSRLLGRS